MSPGLAFVFPGQGTQRVGMGATFRAVTPSAASVYTEASDLLHLDVARLCAESDEATLAETENAQIAIYTTNAAVLTAVRDEVGEPIAVAGHSVGEWSAFYAAGAVSFADGILAVRERARIMSELATRGGMVAIAGLTGERVERLCAGLRSDAETVAVVAVENAPELTVVAGTRRAMEALVDDARSAGATRVVPVRTSHGFHSPLMAAAVEPWRAAMQHVHLETPTVPVAMNHSGTPTYDPEAMRGAAVRQIADRVRWRECLLALAALDVETVIEVGDSKTLTSFTRATLPGMGALAMGAPNALRSLRKLGGLRNAVQ